MILKCYLLYILNLEMKIFLANDNAKVCLNMPADVYFPHTLFIFLLNDRFDAIWPDNVGRYASFGKCSII